MDILLTNYKNIFPFFTDHTYEHSAQVIHYCNVIAGEEIISALNPDEIYILLMGAALHDIGMGISEDDFNDLCGEIPGFADYRALHPDETVGEYTREFHQELSALFIRKYGRLFDIPTPEHLHAICRIARGHRYGDFLNKDDFPNDYPLPNGSRVNLAYLAALVKLADELDITSDRNLFFDYRNPNENWSPKQRMCYKCHEAIRKLTVREDELLLFYETDEPEVEREVLATFGKVMQAFGQYERVIAERSPFRIRLR